MHIAYAYCTVAICITGIVNNKQTNEFILYSMFNPNILLQDDVRMEEVGEEEDTSGLPQLADTLFQNQVNYFNKQIFQQIFQQTNEFQNQVNDFNSVSHELILINLFSV